jgi:hypothetical protein
MGYYIRHNKYVVFAKGRQVILLNGEIMKRVNRTKMESGTAVGSAVARKRPFPAVLDEMSPVKLARHIPKSTETALIARAAGRCEFRGCNEYLYEHPLTTDAGNFAENAHIVAFREAGARGAGPTRPVDINGIDNLMLLCQPCHKNIDSHPKKYPRQELVAQKLEHEARIRFVTGLGPELRTNVLTLKSRIGERVVEISQEEIVDALRPRYPASSAYKVIDLTQLGDESGDGYYPLAARRIRDEVRDMYATSGAFDRIKHLSVFGLAPIPLLVAFGNALSNTIQTDLFQCHRDRAERWCWYQGEPPVAYATSLLRAGTHPRNVAVVLSLSGTVSESALPAAIDQTFTVYVLTLRGATPNPGFLRQREDLEAFRLTYRELLATIVRDHEGLGLVHLFPAAPAPIAIACGFDLLPKAHPAIAVYDFDKRVGGFTERIKVNHYG